jgi:ribonuclease P protein component
MKGTIKSKEDIERLFKNGRRSSSSYVTVLMTENGTVTGRNAFIAGKKLGKAPLRSRCKRVMRQTAHELGAPWSGYDVVFIAKKKIAADKHEIILAATESQLRKLGILS